MDLTKLYPAVDFPVPRETDYLQHIITWDHNEEWIPVFLQKDVELKKPNFAWREEYLFGNETAQLPSPPENYVIQGTSLCPIVCLMNLLMKSMVEKLENKSSMTGYHFEDVQFISDLTFNTAWKSPIQSLLQQGSGKFEMIIPSKSLMVGKLNPMLSPLPSTSIPSDWICYKGQKIVISENQIYDYFSANECFFSGPYRNISSITISDHGFNSKIKWVGDIELYLDGIFRLIMFYWSIQKDTLMDIKSIQQFLFDPSSLPENNAEIDIYYDDNIGQCVGEGVRISYAKTKPMKQFYSSALEVKDRYFTPYVNIKPDVDITELCLQLIRENSEGNLLDVQLVIDERSNICIKMLNALQSKPLHDLMFNLRVRNAKHVTFIPEADSTKRFDGCYLILSENETPEVVKILLNTDIPFYVLHTGDAPIDVENELAELYIQYYNGYRLVLYKKKMSSISKHNYVALSDNYLNELKIIDPKSKKVTVYIYKYSMLSEITNFFISIPINSNNMRFVFIDDTAPPFNQSHKFYKNQLMKDLKINIASGGMWGSLRDKLIPTSSVINFENIKNTEMPMNCIRCANVDLKVVGLNLKNVVTPSMHTKFGLIEYSGKIENDEVFGLGRLSEDNYLEVDKILCWKKPRHWTNEQAATVPLFYAMAFKLLYMNTKGFRCSCESILIHCGHTPFSQAVISVAISLNIKVFTTCYSETQKEFILKTFPQIPKKDIIIMSKYYCNYDLINHIKQSTDGDGVKLVIDALEDFNTSNISMDSVGSGGRYFYVCHNDIDKFHTFGMKYIDNGKSIVGFNPDLMFDMIDDDKNLLVELVQHGIDIHVVKPLENYVIEDICSRKQATDIIVEHNSSSHPTKVLMLVDKKQSLQSYNALTKELAGTKNYMIVGSYGSIWFDITKWLISRGADSIDIVLNQNDIPQYTIKRYNNFIAKHKYVTITFIKTESLDTAHCCNELIKKINNKHSIDVLFYLKPGFEKQMTNIDFALRTYSKSTYLVLIGTEGCKITENWKRDGYKGIAFTLMKNNMRNNTFVSVLDNWLTKWDEVQGFVFVDTPISADDAMNKYSDILPANAGELLDLYYATYKEPSFKETSTRCPPTHFNCETNPVIIFPGLKMAKTEEFAKKLIYPTYMAKYPLTIKSMNELASDFFKLLINNFDQNMFTLIAEGWSGPLVISIAKLLEDNGKISEIILLDASPSAIEQWPSHIMKSKSIISKYLPSINADEKITTNDLKYFCDQITESMASEEFYEYTQDEIRLGLQTLVNRLEIINNFSLNNIRLKSIIHLFTPENTNNNIKELNQISLTKPCKHHIMKEVDSQSFIQCPKLVEDVCNLVLLEYKNCARKQDVEDIGTLDLIFDTQINVVGLKD